METRTRRKGLPRAEQVAHNRARLLEAALHVFRDLGYTGASLDAVAGAAGFTKGAVYSHFASKADLFLSLLEDRIEERVAAQRELVAAQLAESGAEGFFEKIFATSRSDPMWRLAVLEFRVVAARDPELNARYARAHRRTVEGVVEALRGLFDVKRAVPDLSFESLAVAALIIDAGGFLEDVAVPGSLSDDVAAGLFSRLAGLTR